MSSRHVWDIYQLARAEPLSYELSCTAARATHDGYCYFDHDAKVRAARDARPLAYGLEV